MIIEVGIVSKRNNLARMRSNSCAQAKPYALSRSETQCEHSFLGEGGDAIWNNDRITEWLTSLFYYGLRALPSTRNFEESNYVVLFLLPLL